MSGLCANSYAQKDDLEVAAFLLKSMGKVRIVEENQMDAVTALSGSGPAYAFYLLEAMTEAGIKLGLEKNLAADLAQSAVSGAAALIEAQNLDPETLRKKVTSPGGTTQAAINVLDDNNVKQFLISAVLAAAKRSEQLSKQQN
jgi:pyrroline-5-carboxylate reductase